MGLKGIGSQVLGFVFKGLFDKKKPIGLTNLTTTAGGTLVGLAYYAMEAGQPEYAYLPLGAAGLALMLIREWKRTE